MSFIGSMFSNSNGAGYDATANQGTSGPVSLSNVNTNGGQTNTSIVGPNGQTYQLGPSSIGNESQAAASALAGTNANLQQQAQNGSALAQNQLTAATGQNIQQQSGMLSSTKGLSPALAARQASENATSANQTAGNQSAQLQAQTQMAANQQLSNNLLGQQGIYQGALANQNTTQAQIAAGNQANQAGFLGGLMSSAGSAASMLAEGGMVKPHYDDGGDVSPPADTQGSQIASNFANSQMGSKPGAPGTASTAFDPKSGGSGGGGGAMGLLALLAKGGYITDQDQTTAPQDQTTLPPATGSTSPTMPQMSNPVGPKSTTGKLLKGLMPAKNANAPTNPKPAMQQGAQDLGNGLVTGMKNMFGGSNPPAPTGSDATFTNPTPEPAMAKGGKVPAMVSPGERYLPPSEAKKVVDGKKSAMSAGEKIPGKPKVGGAKNSYANDTVPKTLEAGGIVIPRSVTQGKDAQSQAHKFVAAHFKQRGGLPGKKAK